MDTEIGGNPGEGRVRPAFSPSWNEACLRLEEYLGEFHIADRERLLRLTLEILEISRITSGEQSRYDAAGRTLEIAMARVDAWFDKLGGSGAPGDSRIGLRARLAYFTTQADQRWPSSFLEDPPPMDLVREIRAASREAGPAINLSSLQRREVDYGPLEDLARETWEKFSWSHVLRAFGIWVVIFFAAWISYLHFSR